MVAAVEQGAMNALHSGWCLIECGGLLYFLGAAATAFGAAFFSFSVGCVPAAGALLCCTASVSPHREQKYSQTRVVVWDLPCARSAGCAGTPGRHP